jgi:GxxExxY protein
MREINDITDVVIAEALRIHRRVGPGAFESAYEELLYVQLRKRGLGVERQVGLLINFGMDQLRQGISRVVNNYGGEKVTKAAP